MRSYPFALNTRAYPCSFCRVNELRPQPPESDLGALQMSSSQDTRNFERGHTRERVHGPTGSLPSIKLILYTAVFSHWSSQIAFSARLLCYCCLESLLGETGNLTDGRIKLRLIEHTTCSIHTSQKLLIYNNLAISSNRLTSLWNHQNDANISAQHCWVYTRHIERRLTAFRSPPVISTKDRSLRRACGAVLMVLGDGEAL